MANKKSTVGTVPRKKDKLNSDKSTEISRVYHYLYKNIATASQASIDLDIWRANVCWLKRELEKDGLLREVKKDKCPITKHKAAFLSTNPKHR